MNCKYDLEGEPLYDVKWYKDDKQFFGCKADGSVQEFPLDGVSTYHSNYAAIGSCPINLTKLSRNSGGKYKCEVSLDAPTFRTVSETRTFNFIQYSKRTQELKDISTEKIRSSFQNQTSSSSNGQMNSICTILHGYLLVIFMLLFF
ncbi:unnamed protein product [Ceutorhynchus assimilis]|uniref:Ig-like domain-containing protein n=1 Tax=Ceutorhynchus assimilis TaxID=467358 RepID=A0A9N9QEI8_9CUCU|nr:unnamed protein product [Ceutorhynchus assimilis]